mgnify:FL=1
MNSFPHKLGAITGETPTEKMLWLANLKTMSVDQLQQLVDACKYQIGSSGISDMAFALVASCTLAIEAGGPFIGLQLDGYSAAVSSNAQCRDAILELMCNNMSSLVFSAEKRLVMLLLGTAYNVHSINSIQLEAKMDSEA